MNEARALVTLLNRAMMKGFIVFITSFLINNPWFFGTGDDLVILDIDLTETDKEKIRKIFSNVIFKRVQFDNYKSVNFGATKERLVPTYYKLDMFSLYDYSHVVFIDVDTVVIGDISELFSTPVHFIGGVKAYAEKKDKLRGDINSGVVIIDNSCLNETTYKRLINVSNVGYSMPDQKTINLFFKNRIDFFNKMYNVEKRMERTRRYKHIIKSMKIVHYVAGKPWENDDPEKGKYPMMEKIWYDWSKRVNDI